MSRRFSRGIAAVLLGLFLAVGAALPLAQAGDAAMTMVAGDMQPVPCGDCGGDLNDLTAGAMDCVPVCVSPALVASDFMLLKATEFHGPKFRLSQLDPHGRTSSPEPHPPRNLS